MRALVTGATAGMGAEFARQLAAQHYDLVLVARDGLRLEKLATGLRRDYPITVECLEADLLSSEGLAAVEARTATSTDPIDLLVNNAGFGLREPFDYNAVEDELRLLDLLVAVPLRLCHAALVQMLPRGAGAIVNVSSVAAFTPRGTYSAAKAWLLSFSRWAHVQYRSRGVRVTVVAPGFVRTEFHRRMDVSTTTIPGFMWLDASVLVRKALRDSARGKAVSIPTLRYKLVVAVARILPTRIAMLGALRTPE